MKDLQDSLRVKTAEMQIEDFEYIRVESNNGIEIKIFEDGLMILGKSPKAPKIGEDIKELALYYEQILSPALSYIFSLGAPIPKELADIKTVYPYFVVLSKADRAYIGDLLDQFEQKKYFEIINDDFEIFRGGKLYIINNIGEKLSNIEKFVREQIFIREFKGQMHRYLNIHRIIWEKIAEVKEGGNIKGKDIGPFKDKIESYRKSINLIEARINQMDTYIRTREAVIKENKEMAKFVDVLQFKYATLSNTLEYIKDLWIMTKNYVNSALDLFSIIQGKATETSVKNLTVITSMGVGATLIGLFSQRAPEFTAFGAMYFFVLAVIGYSTNKIMKAISMNRKYAIKDIKVAKDIK